MEPRTEVEIYHYPVDEMPIIIRGAIKVILGNDANNVNDAKVIRLADGEYGLQLPKNVSHSNVWSITPLCSKRRKVRS